MAGAVPEPRYHFHLHMRANYLLDGNFSDIIQPLLLLNSIKDSQNKILK